MAEARFVGAPLRLRLGGRRLHLQARMEPQAECMLVLMGATPEGTKELIGFQTGMRKSGQSWKELLVDLKARGPVPPRRKQPLAMARSGSRRPSTRHSRRRVSSDAGCTRH